MSSNSTYIGIAFYTREGYPVQWAIVLSTYKRFDNSVWCGAIIETVEGWVEKWKHCDKSPATLEPYLTLLGVITVKKVGEPLGDVYQSISSLGWKAQNSRGGREGNKYPPSNDYVRRVLLHLCNDKIITLPPKVKNNFNMHVEERLSRFQEKHPPKFNQYPVIPLVEDEDIVFGRTKY